MNLGRNSFIYDASRFLLTAVDLPTVARVVEATKDNPCLALTLKLDMPMVRELLLREEIHAAEASQHCPAISTGKTTPEFLSACCRLVDLLTSPEDIPFLSELIVREVIYRVCVALQERACAPFRRSGIKAIARLKPSHGLPRTMPSRCMCMI